MGLDSEDSQGTHRVVVLSDDGDSQVSKSDACRVPHRGLLPQSPSQSHPSPFGGVSNEEEVRVPRPFLSLGPAGLSLSAKVKGGQGSNSNLNKARIVATE